MLMVTTVSCHNCQDRVVLVVALWLPFCGPGKVQRGSGVRVRGRSGAGRVAIIDAESQRVISQLASPALSQVEWTAYRERVTVGEAAFSMAAEAVANPPPATPALRKAMRQARRPRGG